MPRNAKDEVKEVINSKQKTTKSGSSSSGKKAATSKKSVSKESTKKNTSSKKSSKSKEVKIVKPIEIKKKAGRAKKVVETKAEPAKKKAGRPKKVAETKVEPAKKKTGRPKKVAETKIELTKKKAGRPKKVKSPIIENSLEYYDLPFRYNETVVKLLPQTPKKLFIYWDISDTDRQNLINNFGEDFFNNTKPVLIIHNESNNYSFEIEINDFANCWYLEVTDTSSKYRIELGRRSRNNSIYLPNDYIYISSSNEIESPNDHILFEKLSSTIYFRNVKNNTTYPKSIANMNFMKRIGKIYNIYETYKKLYGKMYSDEDFINNPSSGITMIGE